jgi:hypothetical protein
MTCQGSATCVPSCAVVPGHACGKDVLRARRHPPCESAIKPLVRIRGFTHQPCRGQHRPGHNSRRRNEPYRHRRTPSSDATGRFTGCSAPCTPGLALRCAVTNASTSAGATSCGHLLTAEKKTLRSYAAARFHIPGRSFDAPSTSILFDAEPTLAGRLRVCQPRRTRAVDARQTSGSAALGAEDRRDDLAWADK